MSADRSVERPARSSVDESLLPLDASFRRLMRELEGLGQAELHAFRIERWPRHIHWLGEDGSIAGILRHVTRWKRALAEALRDNGGAPAALEDPQEDTPDKMIDWLSRAQAEMMRSLEPHTQTPRPPWPDHPALGGMNLSKTIDVFQDHDRYHAAQIAYLRQRYLGINQEELPSE